MRLIGRSSALLQVLPGGYPVPNSHGVYADAGAEVFEWRDPARRKEFCQIRILKISDGWIFATRGMPPSGLGWADPLIARALYFSREAALSGAVIRVHEKLCAVESWCFGSGALESWLREVRTWLSGIESPVDTIRFS